MHKLVKRTINKMDKGGSFNGSPLSTAPQLNWAPTAAGLGSNPIPKLGNSGPTAYNPSLLGSDEFTGLASSVGSLASLGNKLFKNNKDSALTKGMDTATDAIANAAMTLGPVGAIVGGGLKVLGLGNSALKAAGVGTDQLTTTDKLLGSNILGLTPVGLANSIGASKLLSFNKDNDTISQVGGAYGGTLSDIDTAAKYSNKKVGLFSNKSKFNNKIATANLEQSKMAGIASDASDRFQNSSNQLLGLGNWLERSGGYNQNGVTFGQQGFKLPTGSYKGFSTPWKGNSLTTWQPNDDRINQIVSYINSQKGKVNWVNRLNEPTLRTIPMGKGEVGSHMLGYGEDDNGVFIFPGIQEINGKLTNLSTSNDGGMSSAIQHHDVVYVPGMTDKEADWFTNNHYKKYWPNISKYSKDVTSMKSGGAFNVIPTGALHKNLHHLDNVDDKYKEVTNKGIPVITDDDGIVQQAEVEREEIIFNLEATKKFEELEKRGTDEAAIVAGKLLTKEILGNTVDTAGLIKKVE